MNRTAGAYPNLNKLPLKGLGGWPDSLRWSGLELVALPRQDRECQPHLAAMRHNNNVTGLRLAGSVLPSCWSPAFLVGARTDPNEQESVVLRPELDELVP